MTIVASNQVEPFLVAGNVLTLLPHISNTHHTTNQAPTSCCQLRFGSIESGSKHNNRKKEKNIQLITIFGCRIASDWANSMFFVQMKEEILMIYLVQKSFKKIEMMQFEMQFKLLYNNDKRILI